MLKASELDILGILTQINALHQYQLAFRVELDDSLLEMISRRTRCSKPLNLISTGGDQSESSGISLKSSEHALL